MIKRFNEVFEIKENDTLGDAIVKGYAKGMIQGIVISGATLTILSIGNKIFKNKMSKIEEEIEEELEDETEVKSI